MIYWNRLPLAVACLSVGLLASISAGQITISSNFENGRDGGWNYDGTYYNVNTGSSAWDWLHFRADGVLGQTPSFRTPADGVDTYRSYTKMVYSYDGVNWQHMDTSDKAADNSYYYFSNSAAFTQDSVYIAYWQPYTYTQATNHYNSLAGNPYVQNRGTVTTASPAGGTYEGRDLYRYQVTDSSVGDAYKQNIVIVARQHGYESLGNYINEGLTDWLISDDPQAAALRQRAVVTVYPMANPDAVVNAWTREGKSISGGASDFNRDWELGAPSYGGAAADSYEINGIRDDAYELTGGQAAWLIDMHSHAKGALGAGWYWWQYPYNTETADFMTDVRNYDLADDGSTVMEWPTSRPGSLTGTTAGAWGNNTLGGNGFTLEPIAAPFGQVHDIDQFHLIGEAIGEAFYQAVPEASGFIAGDANIDGVVDDADYTIWADNYGRGGATFFDGDFNGDGLVDDADYTLWADSYGNLAAGTITPEPAGLTILALAGTALLRRRRP